MKQSFQDRSWTFLLASPSFSGPVFEKSLVLLLEDNKDGAFGVILNHPLENSLSEIDKNFQKYPKLKDSDVFWGGPVSTESICIFVWDGKSNQRSSWKFGLSPEKAENILSKNPEARAIAFLGYTGWGENQLNSEIEEGVWIQCPVDMEALAESEYDEIWTNLMISTNPIYQKLPPCPEKDLCEN